MEQESWKIGKDETSLQRPEGPVLCANNCGFFGSSTTMNLCSRCYGNFVMKQAKVAEVAAAMSIKQSSVDTQQSKAPPSKPSVKVEIAELASTSEEGSRSPQKQQQPNRCFACKKRVGLLGFKCRCGNQFCSLHRYYDKHNCSFDYRAAERDAIAKANPIIKANKLDKI